MKNLKKLLSIALVAGLIQASAAPASAALERAASSASGKVVRLGGAQSLGAPQTNTPAAVLPLNLGAASALKVPAATNTGSAPVRAEPVPAARPAGEAAADALKAMGQEFSSSSPNDPVERAQGAENQRYDDAALAKAGPGDTVAGALGGGAPRLMAGPQSSLMAARRIPAPPQRRRNFQSGKVDVNLLVLGGVIVSMAAMTAIDAKGAWALGLAVALWLTAMIASTRMIWPTFGPKGELKRVLDVSKIIFKYDALSKKQQAKLKKKNSDVVRVLAYPKVAGDYTGQWEMGVYFNSARDLNNADIPESVGGLTTAKKLMSSWEADRDRPRMKQLLSSLEDEAARAGLGPKRSNRQSGRANTKVLAAVAGIAAAALTAGLWLHHEKNRLWNPADLKGEIAALESALDAKNAAALLQIAKSAEERRARIDPSASNAENRAAYDAYLGIVILRARVGANALSKKPDERIGGDLIETWRQRLEGKEAAAVKSDSLKPFAALVLELRALEAEIAREEATSASFNQELKKFFNHGPELGLGEDFSGQYVKADKALDEFRGDEIIAKKVLRDRSWEQAQSDLDAWTTEHNQQFRDHRASLGRLLQISEAFNTGSLRALLLIADKIGVELEAVALHLRAQEADAAKAAATRATGLIAMYNDLAPSVREQPAMQGEDLSDTVANLEAGAIDRIASEAQANAVRARIGAARSALDLLKKTVEERQKKTLAAMKDVFQRELQEAGVELGEPKK